MSIQSFVRCDDTVKQVPILFVLMSRRQKQDYVAVLQAVKERLEDPIVEWFMMDFEAGILWLLILSLFPINS